MYVLTLSSLTTHVILFCLHVSGSLSCRAGYIKCTVKKVLRKYLKDGYQQETYQKINLKIFLGESQ